MPPQDVGEVGVDVLGTDVFEVGVDVFGTDVGKVEVVEVVAVPRLIDTLAVALAPAPSVTL